MKVAVFWSGGKESCLAYHKAVEQGHEVACLLTFAYADPYIFHNFLLMSLASKTLGIPQITVKMRPQVDRYQDMLEALSRLQKEEGIDGFVTGDIAGGGCALVHQVYYEEMCKELGMELVMPLENPSGDRYQLLYEEVASGLRPIINCLNLKYFGEEWLGREFDKDCIKDLKTLADIQKIDACGEDGRGYHTMVIDAPLYKESIEITKFTKKRQDFWLYMDIEEAVLRPKKQRP
jgi:diphthine-ammonia ligase